MDRYERRRQSLLQIIKDRFNGVDADFAKKTDISPSYVSRMCYPEGKEGKKNIGDKMVEKIEAAIPLPRGDMDGLSMESNVGAMPRPGAVWDNEDELDGDEYAFVPRMDMSVPCGDGKTLFTIDEKGQRQALRKSWLQKVGANPATIATITAEGDSMAPRILNDDSIVIDHSQKAITSGKVYVITYDDEWFIKRIFKKPGGGVRITSDNPDKARYPDWELGAEKMDQFTVVARVVALSGAVD